MPHRIAFKVSVSDISPQAGFEILGDPARLPDLPEFLNPAWGEISETETLNKLLGALEGTNQKVVDF